MLDRDGAHVAGLLQWGRRFSSAEMPELRVLAAPVVLASMGPPIFIGGNPDWFAH